MRNFAHLSSGLDVQPLMAAISRNPQIWTEHTERQTYPGTAHEDTECIVLRWCKGIDFKSAFAEIPAFNYPAMGLLLEAHELINYTIHRVGARELGRVLVVNLHVGGKVRPHTDEGAYADHYERFHIALDAEPGCLFNCADETIEMKTGELWCFNHKTEHSVHNLSEKPRLHLIIDCVAPEFRYQRHEVKLAV